MTSATLSGAEIGTIARAVSRAPSVHNSQPWQLIVRRNAVDLLERTEVGLRRHDPLSRDRMLSCGAALTDLELAVRSFGRECVVEVFDDGDVVATATAGGRRPAGAQELALYRAIDRRRSHRRPFRDSRISESGWAALLTAGEGKGVRAVVPERLDTLAEMFGFATRVFRGDCAYQRELEMWTAHTTGLRATGDGVPEDAMSDDALPVAGLIRPDTPVPDDAGLATRLAAENLLILCTDSDARFDHLVAGAALQRVWLTATAKSLAGSVLTQPLHLTGFRERLAETQNLPGIPQAIFRFGHPAAGAAPSPRLPLGELFPHGPTGGLR